MTDIFKAEQKILQEPSLFCARLAKLAWNWKFVEGWQHAIIASKERFNYVNCSRQLGKSHTIMLRAVQKAISIPNALEMIIAEQRQSTEDLRRARSLCVAYHNYLSEASDGKVELQLITDNKTSLELPNGSRIMALPASEKMGGRGFSDATDIYLDEASRLPDEVFVQLEPIITMGAAQGKLGSLFLVSTPNGPDGFFYRESTNPRYTLRIVVPWYESERLKDNQEFKKYLQLSRSLYGEAYVRQEYECEYLDTIGTLFPEHELAKSIDDNQDVFSDVMDKVNKRLQDV